MNGANRRMDGPSLPLFPTMGGSWAEYWPIACTTEHLRTIMSGSVEDLESAAPGHSVRPSHNPATHPATAVVE